MNEPSLKPISKLGLPILIVMLFLSFSGVFVTMWMMDRQAWPSDFSMLWFALFGLAVLFPVLAGHLHAIWLSQKISWLTWWFWLTNASVVGFFVYARLRDESINSYEEEVVSWFFSCFVGGSFGGLLVFGAMRRFAPSLLALDTQEKLHSGRSLNLRTMFFWLTSVAVLLGAIVNGTAFRFVEDDSLPFPLWILLGALNVGLLCGFVFPLVNAWLRNAKPFWMAAVSLLVFSIVVPTVIAAWVTISNISIDTEETEFSIAVPVFLSSMSFYTVIWIGACRQAGFIATEPVVRNSGIGRLFSRICSPFGWSLKLAGVFLGAFLIIFLAGWSYVHFLSGGSERDPRIVQHSIIESLGGTDPNEDWIEVVNQQRSDGLLPENNMALKILRVANPFDGGLFKRVDQLRYAELLGLSESEYDALPIVDFESEFSERHEEYRQELIERYPKLAKAYDDEWMFGGFDEGMADDGEVGAGEFLDDSSMDSGEQEKAQWTREEKLASWILEKRYADPDLLVSALWKDADYPPAAEFLRKNQQKVLRLREASKAKRFYSPLLRREDRDILIMNDNLLKSARFLLRASCFRNIGTENFPEAIKDCKAMWRIAEVVELHDQMTVEGLTCWRCRAVANELALAIVYSGKCPNELLQELLQFRLSSWGKAVTNYDNLVESAYLKAFSVRELLLEPGGTGQKKWSYVSGVPIFKIYEKNPRIVDWVKFNSEFDRLRGAAKDADRRLLNGELNYAQYSEVTDKLKCFTSSTGRSLQKSAHHSIFGNQLITLAKGPESKGVMLAESTAFDRESFNFYTLHFRARQRLAEIGLAIELYRQIHSRHPDELAQLAPEFLPIIKNDPFTHQPLVYQRQGDGFVLYSVGSNMKDDGGGDMDIVFERPCSDLIEYFQRIEDGE